MKNKIFAALAIAMCCTPILNAQNEETVIYNSNDGVNLEVLAANNKRQLEQRDIRYYEVVDTIYTLWVDGESLAYQPGETLLRKQDGAPELVTIEDIAPGDVIYLTNNKDNTLVEIVTDSVYQDYTKSLHVKSVTTRSGLGMGVRIDGAYSYNSAKTSAADISAAIVLNYDLRDWRFTALAGISTAKYGNLSQKNNRYLSPKFGAEVNYKFAATGDLEEDHFSIGIGLEADYRKRYFEDEYMWYYAKGYSLFPNINIAYTRDWFGCKSSLSVRAFIGYRAEAGDGAVVAHGFGCGVGLTYSGLFTNQIK